MPELKKVLIVNPPADGIVFRDLYHTFTSKAAYVWEPADLLILSGSLGRAYHVTLRDCVGGGMDADGLMASLADHARFDLIVSLVGSLTLDTDVAILGRLRQRFTGARVVTVGDFVREKGAQFLRDYPVADACLLDITTDNLVEVLTGWDTLEGPQDNFVIRMKHPLPDGFVHQLNEEFENLLDGGDITQVLEALPEEAGEFAELPRLVFAYDKKSAGRLRQLINRINDCEG